MKEEQKKGKAKPMIYKPTGERQRNDIGLTKEVAGSLVHLIFSGATIYPKSGYVEIPDKEGKTQKLSVNTIKNWITRSNVIPETRRTLREVLDEARVKYHTEQREKRAEKMIDESEALVHRNLRIKSREPVMGMFGVIKDKDGNIVKKENPNILRIKTDTAKFLLERLDPKRYGKVDRGEHKVMHFSLAELRRYEEGLNKEKNES